MTRASSTDPTRTRYIRYQIGRLLQLAEVEDPSAILNQVLVVFLENDKRRPLPLVLNESLSEYARLLDAAANPNGHVSRRRSSTARRGESRRAGKSASPKESKQQLKVDMIKAHERLLHSHPEIADDFIRVLDRVIKEFQRELTGESKAQGFRKSQRKGASASDLQVPAKFSAMPTAEDIAEVEHIWSTELTESEREAYYLCVVREVTSIEAGLVMKRRDSEVRRFVGKAKEKLGKYDQP